MAAEVLLEAVVSQEADFITLVVVLAVGAVAAEAAANRRLVICEWWLVN